MFPTSGQTKALLFNENLPVLNLHIVSFRKHEIRPDMLQGLLLWHKDYKDKATNSISANSELRSVTFHNIGRCLFDSEHFPPLRRFSLDYLVLSSEKSSSGKQLFPIIIIWRKTPLLYITHEILHYSVAPRKEDTTTTTIIIYHLDPHASEFMLHKQCNLLCFFFSQHD